MRLTDDEKRLILEHLESPSVTDPAVAAVYEKIEADLTAARKAPAANVPESYAPRAAEAARALRMNCRYDTPEAVEVVSAALGIGRYGAKTALYRAAEFGWLRRQGQQWERVLP